jgi:multimeric flavodoxin WrbA
MNRVVVINGSPRMEKGNTAMLLESFIQGMEAAGAEIDQFFPSRMNIQPCSCGRMHCWYDVPGQCCIEDDMQQLYSLFELTDILVLAMPVYIPVPGDMQNLINRLCPIIDPRLEFRDGRTRARLRETITISKIALLATSGWWEKENCDTVVRIVRELAEDASVPFAGAVIRPHVSMMKTKGVLTDEGSAILQTVKEAGHALVMQGIIPDNLIDVISRPLIAEEDFRRRLNAERNLASRLTGQIR